VKRAISALLCAVALSASVTAAQAKPHHRHNHVRHHHHQAVQVEQEAPSLFSSGSDVVNRARSYIGATAHDVGVRSTLWCSAFLRKVTGASGVDDRALSWENHQHIAPQVGAVVTMGRRGGGHVGVVSGFTAKGDPIVISGNHGGRVRETVYSRSRIRAWVSAS
jgi:uncharacterized protein (TIGR02594 family)